MYEEDKRDVPRYVHEGAMARMISVIRILAALLVASLVIFVVNNMIWIRHVERIEAQYEISEVTDGVHVQEEKA